MSADDRPTYARGAIRPLECYRTGYQLIKNDYWLFFGIGLIGMLIANFGPLGLLVGPMMCGIYYCVLRKDRGKQVRLEMLFKGFNYFVPSLVATLFLVVPIILIVVPAYILLFFSAMANAPAPGAQPDPNFAFNLLGGMGIVYAVLILVTLVLSVLFFFAYPLIVAQGMSGLSAIGTSMRAAIANLWGVLGIVVLNMLFSMLGSLACCVGAFFVIPVHFAAVIAAYRQAFPEADDQDEITDD